MLQSLLSEYVECLVQGHRLRCRELVDRALAMVPDPRQVLVELFWPAMEQIDRLYREDKINLATEHMATRITRRLADRVSDRLKRSVPLDKRIAILSADGEPEELGAAMAADLFEADGWEVFFVGGGVANDEVLALVGKLRPDILFIFGTTPQGVPGVRRLIDLLRDVGVHPTMNVMVSGGVFRRAEGLWQEVNADLYAPTLREALSMAASATPRKPEVRIPGAPKKRRRRRRPPLLAEIEA